MVVKHIDSHIPKERYKAYSALLFDYAKDNYKYLLTKFDYFTK